MHPIKVKLDKYLFKANYFCTQFFPRVFNFLFLFALVSILSERASKQRAFCSIFESTSPKCQSRNIEKKQKSEANKMKEEYCRMQTGQSLTTPKHLEQKILCTEATDTRSIPEITPFKSIHPTRMAEKSLMNVNLMEYRDKKGTSNCKSSEKVRVLSWFICLGDREVLVSFLCYIFIMSVFAL